jgi:hypothetical protein
LSEEAEADPLIAIAGGGVNLFNSMGNPWTADQDHRRARWDVRAAARNI